MKDVIYEKDIKSIVITDGVASLKYTKQNKDSNLYDLRYNYVTSENEMCCPYCGRVWDASEGQVCADCNGEAREVYASETVTDMIYSMLEDECTVRIEFWNGTKKEYSL